MHTPGPWTAMQIGDDYRVGTAQHRVFSIRRGVIPSPEDARLIAAAPDLLAALRAFEEQATKLAGFSQAYDPYLGALGRARAAIAKAIGG